MESCYYHMPWLLKLRPEPFEGRLKLLVEWGELLSIKLVEVWAKRNLKPKQTDFTNSLIIYLKGQLVANS